MRDRQTKPQVASRKALFGAIPVPPANFQSLILRVHLVLLLSFRVMQFLRRDRNLRGLETSIQRQSILASAVALAFSLVAIDSPRGGPWGQATRGFGIVYIDSLPVVADQLFCSYKALVHANCHGRRKSSSTVMATHRRRFAGSMCWALVPCHDWG